MSSVKNILLLLYSGKLATGIIGAFWFVPALFIAELLVYLLINKFNLKKTIIISLIMYVIMFILERAVIKELPLPWNINVVPIAIIFLLLGYTLKKYLNQINLVTLITNIVFLVTILLFNFIFKINFIFDLKYYTAIHLIEDLIVPITISLMFIQCFKLYNVLNIKLLRNLGLSSLTIMFMHNFFIELATNYIYEYWLITFIFSLTMSYLFSILVSYIKVHITKKQPNLN